MFDRVKYKEDAKEALYAHNNRSGMIGAQVFYSFVRNGIVLVIVPLLAAAATALGAVSALVLILLPLYAVLLALAGVAASSALVPLQIGLARYYLHTNKYGIRPYVLGILDGLDYYWNIFALAFARWFYVVRWPLLLVVCGGILTVIMFFMDAVIAAVMVFAAACLAALIWAYYMHLRTWPYAMIIADHPQIKAEEMLERCKSMTEGHVFDLFVFELSYIGWGFIDWLTFGIAGLLYVMPYYNMACTNVYAALKGRPIVLDALGAPVGQKGGTVPVTGVKPEGPDTEPPEPPIAEDKPMLKGIAGRYKGYSFILEPDETTIIGRDASRASIVLAASSESDDIMKVGRSHCSVRYNSQTGKYEVTDLQSMNGVFVNGRRIEAGKAVCLPRGTEIFLGSLTANGFRLV